MINLTKILISKDNVTITEYTYDKYVKDIWKMLFVLILSSAVIFIMNEPVYSLLFLLSTGLFLAYIFIRFHNKINITFDKSDIYDPMVMEDKVKTYDNEIRSKIGFKKIKVINEPIMEIIGHKDKKLSKKIGSIDDYNDVLIIVKDHFKGNAVGGSYVHIDNKEVLCISIPEKDIKFKIEKWQN